jgi:hypothetical protein
MPVPGPLFLKRQMLACPAQGDKIKTRLQTSLAADELAALK